MPTPEEIAARICEKDAPPLSITHAPDYCELLARALLDEAQAFAEYRVQVQRVAKTRNVAASCENCPYSFGSVCVRKPATRSHASVQICGEHPDFWATPEDGE